MKKLVLFAVIILVISCNQEPSNKTQISTAKTEIDSLQIAAQKVFAPLPAFAENTENILTQEKVNLGRILFYDTRLSNKGNNSCNSCHNLESFGVDHQSVSKGDAGNQGSRNSPTVLNAALHQMQFWDGRAKAVEDQAGMPILNSVEMRIPHKAFLMDRLSKLPLYQRLFKAAFPEDRQPLNYDNLEKAIAAFERTLLTPSRFDKYLQGDQNAISNEEKAGLAIFIQSGCTTCHNGVGIGGGSLQRFGLYNDYRTYILSKTDDEGRKSVTGQVSDKDVFKVPGLRNIQGTYPYFHNGSIYSLDSAIMIMASAQLNKKLTSQQISQIKTFLNSLSGTINEQAKTFPVELKN